MFEISHSGEHPRLGALDVCPFIPVRGVTMEECVECAKEFAERLANEFGVPGIMFHFDCGYWCLPKGSGLQRTNPGARQQELLLR